MSRSDRYSKASRGRWEPGGDGRTEWAFEGGPKAVRPVGEPEGTSVIKAGACQCALSGRFLWGAKPGGTAEVYVASVPAEKLGTEAFFFCPGTL